MVDITEAQHAYTAAVSFDRNRSLDDVCLAFESVFTDPRMHLPFAEFAHSYLNLKTAVPSVEARSNGEVCLETGEYVVFDGAEHVDKTTDDGYDSVPISAAHFGHISSPQPSSLDDMLSSIVGEQARPTGSSAILAQALEAILPTSESDNADIPDRGRKEIRMVTEG